MSDDSLSNDLVSLQSLALKSIEILNELGKSRFSLPWRWCPWSNNYQQALSQFTIDDFEV